MLTVTYDEEELENNGIAAVATAVKGGAFETLTLTLGNTSAEDELDIRINNILSGFEILTEREFTIEPEGTHDVLIKTVTDVPGEFNRTLKIYSPSVFLVQFAFIVQEVEGFEVYTNRTQINKRYGVHNINAWADLDGELDDNKIEAVVYQFCIDCSRMIDAMLETGFYQTPFTTPYPSIIEQVCANKVAQMLYTSKGLYVEHLDKLMSIHANSFKSKIDAINRGKLRLDGSAEVKAKTNAPFIPSATPWYGE